MKTYIYKHTRFFSFLWIILIFSQPALSAPLFYSHYQIIASTGMAEDVAIGELNRLPDNKINVRFYCFEAITQCTAGSMASFICNLCQNPRTENQYTTTVLNETGNNSQWQFDAGQTSSQHETVIQGGKIINYLNYEYTNPINLTQPDVRFGHVLYIMFSRSHEQFLQNCMQSQISSKYLALVLPFVGLSTMTLTVLYNEFVESATDKVGMHLKGNPVNPTSRRTHSTYRLSEKGDYWQSITINFFDGGTTGGITFVANISEQQKQPTPLMQTDYHPSPQSQGYHSPHSHASPAQDSVSSSDSGLASLLSSAITMTNNLCFLYQEAIQKSHFVKSDRISPFCLVIHSLFFCRNLLVF